MKRLTAFGLILSATLLCLPAFAADLSVKVTAITVEGKSEKSAANVLIKRPGNADTKPETLKLDDELGVGTIITPPARTVIELTSSHDNKITIEPGCRLIINQLTARGESYSPQELRRAKFPLTYCTRSTSSTSTTAPFSPS